jgi:hypothetical protein
VSQDLRGNLARMDKALKAGDLLRDGRYEIEELLRSAIGKKVYRARDRVLDFLVALDVFSNNSIMPSGLTVSAWEAHGSYSPRMINWAPLVTALVRWAWRLRPWRVVLGGGWRHAVAGC